MTDNRLILDEPESVYFKRDPAVASNSGLKILDSKSPAHYKYWCDTPDDEDSTAAFAFGHAFHCATIEPQLFDSRYRVLPEDAPRRPTPAQWSAAKSSPSSQHAKDWWTLWNLDGSGKKELSASDYDMARRMGDRQRTQVVEFPGGVSIVGGELFDLCQKEVTLRWTDPETGLQCKARVDLHCAELRFGGDLKSTVDASPNAFANAVHRYRYHQQAAHYLAGAEATGTPWDLFLFFASEKTPPFEPAHYHLPPMAIERGLELRDRGLKKLAACVASGRWSGYTPKLTELNLPAFAYYETQPEE